MSGHVRICPDTRWSSRAVSSVAGHAVLYGPSRREWPVAGSRAGGRVACGMARRRSRRPVWPVAYRIARRRIASISSSRTVSPVARHGVPYGRSRAVSSVAGSRAVRSVAGVRLVPTRIGDLCVSAVFTVGRAERPSSAMPRPNSACRRRRYRRLTNVYSFAWPSRFMVAPSAARLRRTVGPLSTHKAGAGRSRQRDIIGHIRASSGHIRASSGHIRAYPDT